MPVLASRVLDGITGSLRHSAYPGFFAAVVIAESISLQGCLLSHQISIVGLTHELSSSVPDLTAARLLNASNTVVMGEPQWLQKLRVTDLPECPFTVN